MTWLRPQHGSRLLKSLLPTAAGPKLGLSATLDQIALSLETQSLACLSRSEPIHTGTHPAIPSFGPTLRSSVPTFLSFVNSRTQQFATLAPPYESSMDRGLSTLQRPLPESFKKETMLEMLRNVPMPVVVVTAAAPPDSTEAASAASDDDLLLRGLTCSSFCAISVEPPLVSVCIQKNSVFLPLVTRTPVFAVHLLHDGHKDVANNFAKRYPDLNKATFGQHAGAEWELYHPEEELQVLEGTKCAVPVIKGTQAVMVCSKKGLHSYGDHVMLVGEVMSQANGQGDPLIYMNRQYRQLGGHV